MPLKTAPNVVLMIAINLYYGREVMHGIFDYVRKHRPWNYITGNILAGDGLDFQDRTAQHAVIGMLGSGDFLQAMKRRKIPTVNISERLADVGTARILPDNLEVGRLAARYFMDKKFTNFAFTGVDEFAFSRLRHQGFEEEVRKAGHFFTAQNFGTGKWPAHSMDPLPEIGEWIKSLPKPCAIFTHGDDHARSVLNECQRLKIRVPEELAVLGCNNDEIDCELSPTPLSSVVLPLRRIGYEAARMVEHLLEGGAPPKDAIRLAPTGIATRRSTDIIAVQDPMVARAISFITARASEPIDVSDVVKASGASRRYLERRFATLLGRTPKQEILRVRVAMAKRLLLETLLPMPDVAESSGFTDSKMLSSVFMRDVGMTPSEFRRTARAKEQEIRRR